MSAQPASDLLPRWTQQRWMEDANCRGRTELFFPPAGEQPRARATREAAAASLCQSCPVRAVCRAYAREHEEYGFWGGESEEIRAVDGCGPAHVIGIRRIRKMRAERDARRGDSPAAIG